jgi:succinate-semialdehyde dehydrogenase/glutarate-semialdehyde dehydrogenase
MTAELTERGRLDLRRPDLLREAALIGGQWRDGPPMAVLNPATGGLLGSVPALGGAQAQEAVAAAEAALPAWRAQPARARAELLHRWRDNILAHQRDLARLMTAEQGKPLAEAEAEIAYAAAYVRWFAEEAPRAYGELTPGPAADRRVFTLKQPVGVVGAITPWNFPAAMVTRKAAPALAAGCTMVLKPSELTPFTALALATLLEEAGAPPGVLNVVTGDPAAIGGVLTEDPRVRKLSFTGSTAVGKMLAARCAGTVKRVSLELGGNAPFLIFDDADLEAAVEGAMLSKFRNTGQTCVCANRFLVQAGVYDAFAEALARRAERLVVGDGLAQVTDQGPLINAAAIEKVESHVVDALNGGARVLAGGERLDGPGAYFRPTVLTEVSSNARLAREETFGPVAGLIRFEHEADGLALANSSAAGLAAYVYTRDLSRAWRSAEALEYGLVGLNTGLVSNEAAPFGGVKEAGLGREGSRHGLDEYLELKAVTLAL